VGGVFQSGGGIANCSSLPKDVGYGWIYVCSATANQEIRESDVSTCIGTLHICDKDGKSRILGQSQRVTLNISDTVYSHQA
jgi:hypothetical protein